MSLRDVRHYAFAEIARPGSEPARMSERQCGVPGKGFIMAHPSHTMLTRVNMPQVTTGYAAALFL